ncbi:Primase C terminal 1 (PriCT-1) [Parelusimicrobium proximum]|uniref:bifunctional DNA primase/polymerase n=1 Tax=Parelusimicrobium proximum TaxID=3228953 RepID=UPI003D168015
MLQKKDIKAVKPPSVLLKQIQNNFKIFPIWYAVDNKCACFNSTCSCPCKHPIFKGGYKIATSNLTRVENWLKVNPKCNWAVATGKPSNIVVIDVDLRKSGDKSISSFNLPPTYTVSTGNGFHYYFNLPKEHKYLSSKNGLLDGVDFKANGGYVIIPPSTHFNGTQYKILKNKPLVDLSESLLSLILSKVKDNTFREGERNNQLFRIGIGFAYNKSRDKKRLINYLNAVNTDRCKPSLSEDEVRTLANNILKTISRRTKAL